MPTLLTSGLFIDHLRFAVQSYRVWRRGAYEMALELKGLKAKSLKARASLDALNTAYDKFNADAVAHGADVAALTKDLEGMQEDLQFATATLGNSVNGSAASEVAAEPLTLSPAIQQPSPPQTAPAPTAESPVTIPVNISPETHTRDSNGAVILK